MPLAKLSGTGSTRQAELAGDRDALKKATTHVKNIKPRNNDPAIPDAIEDGDILFMATI